MQEGGGGAYALSKEIPPVWPNYLTYLPDYLTSYLTYLTDLPTRPTWANHLQIYLFTFFREHPWGAIIEICDIWDTDYNSDNWDLEFMTIFVNWQLRMTVDSIRNSCNVFIPSLKSVIYRVIFCNWPPQFQYQEENLQSANHSLFYLPDLLEQQVWLADWRFSFWYWNWRGQLKKSPCIIVIKIRELIRYKKMSVFYNVYKRRMRCGGGVGGPNTYCK